MAEAVLGGQVRRPARNTAFQRDAMPPRSAAMSRSVPPPCLGQAQIELLRALFRAIHMPVDRLVAQPLACFPVSLCFLPEPPGDLLRRPACAQRAHHMGKQILAPRELGQAPAPGVFHVMRGDIVVSSRTGCVGCPGTRRGRGSDCGPARGRLSSGAGPGGPPSRSHPATPPAGELAVTGGRIW